MDSKHVVLANGAFPSYLGASLDLVEDVQGKPLGQSMWDGLSKGGVSSTKWNWFNPVTGKLERKVSFAEKVEEDVACSVGYYKPE